MSLWSKCRRTILAIVLLLAVGWLLNLYSKLVNAPPVDDAISLNSAGVAVERTIWVLAPDSYRLAFVFDRTSEAAKQRHADIAYVLPGQPGVAIPLAWSVTDGEGNKVASGTSHTTGSDRATARTTRRTIDDKVRLNVGRYQFRAELLEPVPELAPVATRIRLQIDPKTGDSWQLGIARFWAPLLTQLLGPAVLLVLLGVLLVKMFLHFRPQPVELQPDA